MGERVTLYRFGNAEGLGFNTVSYIDRSGDPVYMLMHQACLEIRCPQEDRTEDGRVSGCAYFEHGKHFCWLSFEQITRAAERLRAENGDIPSFIMRDLWQMDVPREACVFLKDQVLVDYTYGQEVDHV